MNISDAKLEFVNRLRSIGLQGADLDVDVLLCHCLSWSRAQLIRDLNSVISPGVFESVSGLIDRRLKGEPVAYLINEKEFYGRSFYVDSRVLIPRPDSEIIIEELIKEASLRFGGNSSFSVIEVGVGSGALILTSSLEIDNECASFCGVDISKDALSVASKNKEGLGDKRVSLLESDLLDVPDGPFDFIIANLPYLKTSDINLLEVGVRDYEPSLALDGGEDGLDLYRRLFLNYSEKFGDVCSVYCELDPDQIPILKDYIVSINLNCSFEVCCDLSGIDRLLKVVVKK